MSTAGVWLLFMISPVYSSGASTQEVKFADQQSCLFAADVWVKTMTDLGRAGKAFCVPEWKH